MAKKKKARSSRKRASAPKRKAAQSKELAQLEFDFPGRFTATELDLPKMDIAQWSPLGRKLAMLHSALLWGIGDWLSAGERNYGEMYAQAASESKLSEDSLMRYKRVSMRVEPIRRRAELTWSHHVEVAAMPPDEQDYWLQKAIDNDWSVAELHEAKRKKGSREVGESETADEKLCPICHEHHCDVAVCHTCMQLIAQADDGKMTKPQRSILEWALDYIIEPADAFFVSDGDKKKWQKRYDWLIAAVGKQKKKEKAAA